MNPWPFVLAAYALGVAVPIAFGAGAWLRARDVRRQLAALEASR